MPDTKHLPHLLQLLDDPSEVVRGGIGNALSEYGPDLDVQLERMLPPVTREQRAAIHALLAGRRRANLFAAWRPALQQEILADQLEAGFAALSAYLNEGSDPARLGRLLDVLAARAEEKLGPTRDGIVLARFLFHEYAFTGARDDYHMPHNSDLAYVLETRRGLPISLACIYLLVGHRLGIPVQGINWPGHFLAKTRVNNEDHIVDGFDGGQCIPRSIFLRMQGPSKDAAAIVLDRPATAAQILGRVLNNLCNALAQAERPEDREVMLLLREELMQD